MSFLDAAGSEIGDLIAEAATQHNISVVGLLALGQAESTWRRRAERWGDRTGDALAALVSDDMVTLRAIYDDIQRRIPNDISWGYGQISIGLAARYGLGNGGWDGLMAARQALFDARTNLQIMAHHYRNTMDAALRLVPTLGGYNLLLAGMCIYNGGNVPGLSPWYDQQFAANIQRYRDSLAWAYGILAVQP